MLLGFVFFGHIPEFMSIIGYAVIIASAVMMFIYNTRRKDV